MLTEREVRTLYDMASYTVERGVIMRNARDREAWPGWWLRLGWV